MIYMIHIGGKLKKLDSVGNHSHFYVSKPSLLLSNILESHFHVSPTKCSYLSVPKIYLDLVLIILFLPTMHASFYHLDLFFLLWIHHSNIYRLSSLLTRLLLYFKAILQNLSLPPDIFCLVHQ